MRTDPTPRLTDLNTQSPVDDPVWEGLGGIALLEQGCHWGVGFEVSKVHSQCVPLCLLLPDQGVLLHTLPVWTLTLWNAKPN